MTENLPAEEINVISFDPIEWPDSCLGRTRRDRMRAGDNAWLQDYTRCQWNSLRVSHRLLWKPSLSYKIGGGERHPHIRFNYSLDCVNCYKSA